VKRVAVGPVVRPGKRGRQLESIRGAQRMKPENTRRARLHELDVRDDQRASHQFERCALGVVRCTRREAAFAGEPSNRRQHLRSA
jgi:hypothetical protein